MTEAFTLDSVEQGDDISVETDLRLITGPTEISLGEHVRADLLEGQSWVLDYRDCESNNGMPRRYRAIPLAGTIALSVVK